MKENYTEIILLLDKSGSMGSVLDDTIGGYNQFIKDQKDADGEAKFTLVLFNNFYRTIYDAIDIQEVPELTTDTYKVGSTTALYDTIGYSISNLGNRLAKMEEADRPENIVFVILTDGAENASREMDSDSIFKMITHQTEKYNWDFVFLGANQDAFKESGKLGFSKGSTMTYSAGETVSAFGSMSRGLSETRMGKRSSGTDYFNDADRKVQDDALKK